MATGNRKSSQQSDQAGEQTDKELQQLLKGADPTMETSLEVLRVSEEHYFAAVHQEGNAVPMTHSSSTEL